MSARVLLALAVLGLQISAHSLSQPLPDWVFWLSAGYIAVTMLQRGLARPRGGMRADQVGDGAEVGAGGARVHRGHVVRGVARARRG